MCGITGIWDFSKQESLPHLKATTKKMTDTLSHRGPDGACVWVDTKAHLALGHRRLSIIDLSTSASQPMVSNSGRFVITYNGEIYNYQSLRNTLKQNGLTLKTKSDTEAILEMCAHFGIEETLQKVIGMFAFCLWDTASKKLFLVRDRLGIKPLYWGMQNNIFAFGSELQSLKPASHWKFNIDTEAVGAYFLKGYVPAPQSIYQNIFKLEPGHILVVDQEKNIQKKAYWSVEDSIQPKKNLSSPDQLINDFDILITDAVQKRLVSDVPIGCFLSGGIDSATIAAKMQTLSPNKIKTFSIGFEEDPFNEAPQARKIATYLGTDHNETIITTKESLHMAKDAHIAYDEPFSDSSQIPTLLVSKTARQHVTVALSGDGGDEVFAGYNRYRAVQKLWPFISKMPPFLKVGAQNMILLLSPLLNHSFAKSVLQTDGNLKGTLQKMAHVFCADSIEDFYYKLTSQKIPLTHIPLPHLKPERKFVHLEPFEHFQYWDLIDYLPNDILTKVDRASMHTGLEARVPLLDHRIVERVWQLPANTKLRHGESKWLLRQVLEKHIPQSLYAGPKRGFAIPLSTWLRGPLKKWAEEIIYTENDFIDKKQITNIWDQHQTERHDYGTQIWTVISFNLWYQNHT